MSAARETSGTTMCLVARYVRQHAGDEGLRRVHAAAGLRASVEALDDERRWFTYEDKIALFEAAAVELDDADVTRHLGERALSLQIGAGLQVLLRSLGSPRVVLSNVAKAAPKFSAVATMEVLELGRTHAVVSYELRGDKVPNRLDCLYKQGLISAIGPLFGMPLLEVDHPECQVLGAPRCIYKVRWASRHLLRRRAREAHLIDQSAALAVQLEAMQSTAADLVSADDISEVLARIVGRAAAAVSAPRYLLAVRDHERLIVRADGFGSVADEQRTAEEMLAGRDVGEHALVQEIASAHHVYGVLAAFYDEHSFFDYERGLFKAYASSAAVALDVVSARDEARRAEATAERERERLEEAQRVAGLGSFEQVVTTSTVYPSRELCRLLGVPFVEHFDVASVLDRVHPDDRATLVTAMKACAETGKPVDLVHRLVWPDGTMRWVHSRALRSVGDDDKPRVVGTALDITGWKQTRDDLNFQDSHDALTGLANRKLFLERLDLAYQTEPGPDRIAVVLLDIDDFKTVNDAFGHAVGDQLIVALAGRLASVTRTGDTLARVGGDEFALVLASGAITRTAENTASRIAAQLTSPFHVGDVEVILSVSIGIAVAGASHGASQDVLRDADLATYLAKQHGKGHVELARPRMQDEALHHLAMITDLRHAQARGELEVFYQAVVNARDATPAGAEALIRWNHPQRGLVSPDEFIHEAESTGLIVPIGDWVLNEACRQTQAWRCAGTVDDDFYVSVNLSPHQLAEPSLVDDVARALRDSGLPPRALALEITESTLMLDFDAGVARLQSLKDLGLRIALDDYGTGYSSLNRLAKLPVDIVKIDKSFIDQLTFSQEGRALVQSVIDVTKALRMKSVAEGVERPDQHAALEELECDYIQGYLFAKPIPPTQTADLLRRLATPADKSEQPRRSRARNEIARVSP